MRHSAKVTLRTRLKLKISAGSPMLDIGHLAPKPKPSAPPLLMIVKVHHGENADQLWVLTHQLSECYPFFLFFCIPVDVSSCVNIHSSGALV